MQSILLIIHVLMALTLIGLILIQHGKGADAGAAFGSGASSTVFGASGSGSFLTKATGILAFVFFANSFFLSYLSTSGSETQSLMEQTQKVEGSLKQPETEGGAESAAPENNDLPQTTKDQESDKSNTGPMDNTDPGTTDLPDVPQ